MEERISMHSHRPHATSQPSRFSHAHAQPHCTNSTATNNAPYTCPIMTSALALVSAVDIWGWTLTGISTPMENTSHLFALNFVNVEFESRKASCSRSDEMNAAGMHANTTHHAPLGACGLQPFEFELVSLEVDVVSLPYVRPHRACHRQACGCECYPVRYTLGLSRGR